MAPPELYQEFNVRQFLDTVGDGSGDISAVGDYSSAEARFKIVPAPGETMYLHSLIFSLTDAGPINAGFWGSTQSPLSNGIVLGLYNVADDSLIIDFTDREPLITNLCWARVCYEVKADDFGVGNNGVSARWSVDDDSRDVILTDKTYLAAVLNDDFTPLITQHFLITGRKTRDV